MRKNFLTRVLEIVARIPRGRTMTYKQVAAQAGHPRSYRAVGSILKRNFNPRIPCHRVIRSDGAVGGYNRGMRKKISLLKAEGSLQ